MKRQVRVFLIVGLVAAASAVGQAKKGAAKSSPTPEKAAASAAGAPSTTPASAAGGSSPCAAPEFHQFDFWLGEWKVNDAEGKAAGENRIVAVVGGCALQENWSSVKGGRGTSLNIYDATAGRWHQTWVDDSGGILLLEGEFRDGKMVLLGRHRAQRDKSTMITHRIAWTPEGPDRVHQVWEASTNDGRTWKTVFDGVYIRKK